MFFSIKKCKGLRKGLRFKNVLRNIYSLPQPLNPNVI